MSNNNSSTTSSTIVATTNKESNVTLIPTILPRRVPELWAFVRKHGLDIPAGTPAHKLHLAVGAAVNGHNRRVHSTKANEALLASTKEADAKWAAEYATKVGTPRTEAKISQILAQWVPAIGNARSLDELKLVTAAFRPQIEALFPKPTPKPIKAIPVSKAKIAHAMAEVRKPRVIRQPIPAPQPVLEPAWRRAVAKAKGLLYIPYVGLLDNERAMEGCFMGVASTTDGPMAVYLVDVIDREAPGKFAAWGVIPAR